MDLENRIRLLVEVGEFMQSDHESWESAKTRAYQHNPWFIPSFIDLAVENIVQRFLKKDLLEAWINSYDFDSQPPAPKKVGIVMAGNIPLVGFHDFLCCFITGHRQVIKLSSKDLFLLPALIHFMKEKNPTAAEWIETALMLRGLDAYIATGSSNSARYFDYYFAKYPSLIRRNKTSVAMLDGHESSQDLEKVADDVFLYFGLGCRNVTKIYVPEKYDFIPLLTAFRKYQWMADHHKYKNNYDYRLSLAILNKLFYMTNDCILLLENESDFSPISVLHYAYYKNYPETITPKENENLQLVVGKNDLPFGKSQQPELGDYADGVNTLQFLQEI